MIDFFHLKTKNEVKKAEKSRMFFKTVLLQRSYFIHKEVLSSLKKNIRLRDLIAIITSIPHLDRAHFSFFLEKKGRIHVLHPRSKN